MRILGAPKSPFVSTSQPSRASREFLAAASAVTCAISQPVVSAKLAPFGNPSSSFNQPPQTSSITATAGPQAYDAAFWSQALVSQSAASAAGSAPPMTQP